MPESLADMMGRLNDGIPSEHWKPTSVGTVNFRNKGAVARAAVRLAKLKAARKSHEIKPYE